jgi:hypothetical protein
MAVAGDKPVLWGQGIQRCEVYARAWEQREAGIDAGIADYGRFQDWFTGFVSGLSLATGMDVLHGVDITGAMRRISIHCEDNPADDFFNASMDLVRVLSAIDAARARRPAAPTDIFQENPATPDRP